MVSMVALETTDGEGVDRAQPLLEPPNLENFPLGKPCEQLRALKSMFLSEGSPSENATRCMIPTHDILEKAKPWRWHKGGGCQELGEGHSRWSRGPSRAVKVPRTMLSRWMRPQDSEGGPCVNRGLRRITTSR